MGTTIAFTFPLGRYHATRWDGGANTSEPEWPPSPWRILRALIATWYARWPDLPAEDLDRILAALGSPDAFRTPPARVGTSRHYLPDRTHTSGTTGNTDQVIDAFLALQPDAPLLVHWQADLHEADRRTLTKLVELVPYLGRSESICHAALVNDATPDARWWRLGEAGPGVRESVLLAPDGVYDRSALEASTSATRKARRLTPLGARYVSYGVHLDHEDVRSIDVGDASRTVTAMRFGLLAQVPARARNAVVLADAAHAAIAKIVNEWPTGQLLGRAPTGAPRTDDHAHLHIHALGDGMSRVNAAQEITSLLLWIPEGLSGDLAAEIQARLRHVWVPPHLEGMMPRQDITVGEVGEVGDIAPEITGPARVWKSITPYLPVRHRKQRQTLVDHLEADLAQECRYRSLPEPARLIVDETPVARRDVASFRRRRNAPSSPQYPGWQVRLEFDRPVHGPLALGRLSHFGLGLFVPDERRAPSATVVTKNIP